MTHPKTKSVGWVLIQAARLHRLHLGEQLADRGLYPGQEKVLNALMTAGHLSASELAEILRVRPPKVSKSINRMTALGLVGRLRDAGDHRGVRLKLTPQGHTLVGLIETSWQKDEDNLVSGFDDKDRRRLRKLLHRASKNLAAALGGDERQFDVPDDVLDEAPTSRA